MITKEKVKRYFWYLFGIMGVVFFWTGVWDGIGGLPYISNPLISLTIGLAMLLLSSFIFKGENPFLEKEKAVFNVLHKVHTHPQREEFQIKYTDKLRKGSIQLGAKLLKRIEKEFLVFSQGKRELFVPIHRVVEIKHKGKTHWKA